MEQLEKKPKFAYLLLHKQQQQKHLGYKRKRWHEIDSNERDFIVLSYIFFFCLNIIFAGAHDSLEFAQKPVTNKTAVKATCKEWGCWE